MRHGDQLPTFRNEFFACGTLVLALPDEVFAFADQRLAFGQEIGRVDLAGSFLAGGEEVEDDRTHFGPFPAQRCQHDRLDEDFNIFAAGIMGAELGAFGGIEPTLEQGAEDRRVHGIPFELRGLVDGVDLVFREFQRGCVGEQVAVEVPDFIDAKRAAMGHALKQRSHHLLQDRRLIAVTDDHLGEKPGREQSDVLGKKAKDHPVEKLGHRMRVETTLPQALGNIAETGGGFFSDSAVGCARAEFVRLKEKAAQHFQATDRADLTQGDPMHLRRRAGEVGVDFKVARVAGDKQRRIIERLAVLQELLVGLGEVGASALVFEGEEAAFPDVGPTVAAAALGGPFFEGKDLAGGVGFSRLGVADQFAEVEEMLLVGGALGEIGGSPFGDESGRRHATVMSTEGRFFGKG